MPPSFDGLPNQLGFGSDTYNLDAGMCFSGMLLILAVEDESARAEMAVKRENRNRMMEINVSDYSYLGYTEEVMHTSEGCSMGQAERCSERTPPFNFIVLLSNIGNEKCCGIFLT